MSSKVFHLPTKKKLIYLPAGSAYENPTNIVNTPGLNSVDRVRFFFSVAPFTMLNLNASEQPG